MWKMRSRSWQRGKSSSWLIGLWEDLSSIHLWSSQSRGLASCRWRAAFVLLTFMSSSGFSCWRWSSVISLCVLQVVGVHGSGAAAWPLFSADQRCHLPRGGSATSRCWSPFQSCSSVSEPSGRGHEQTYQDLPGEALCESSCLQGLAATSFCCVCYLLSNTFPFVCHEDVHEACCCCICLSQAFLSWASSYQPVLALLHRWKMCCRWYGRAGAEQGLGSLLEPTLALCLFFIPLLVVSYLCAVFWNSLAGVAGSILCLCPWKRHSDETNFFFQRPPPVLDALGRVISESPPDQWEARYSHLQTAFITSCASRWDVPGVLFGSSGSGERMEY